MCRHTRAVTLLEVLLAMGLLVFLSSMTYWFYASALNTRQKDTEAAQDLQLMRITLARMAAEIRQASQITAGDRVGIRGEAERVWLSTTRTPSKAIAQEAWSSDDPGPREYDLVKIEYRIARHPDLLHDDGYPKALGLARVEHRVPRPDSAQSGEALAEQRSQFGMPSEGIGAEAETTEEDSLFEEESNLGAGVAEEIEWEQLYSTDIKFLRFCYYDGHKWWDDWDITGQNPLPQLVQVTLGFNEHPPLNSEFGVADEDAEEFCTCMNRVPSDCLHSPDDQFTMTVRIPQADPLFRSRVGREVKALTDQLNGSEETTRDPVGASSTTGTTSGSAKSKTGSSARK